VNVTLPINYCGDSDQSMNVVIDDGSYFLNEIAHTATASTCYGPSDYLRGIFPARGVVFTVNRVGRPPRHEEPWRLPVVPGIFIPASVERLSSHSFSGRQPIQFVSFEYASRLRQIGKSAFAGSPTLLSICLPRSVETIGCDCFSRLPAMRLISFEFGFRESLLERGLFYRCSSLSTICIPGSVEELRAQTFERCEKLSVVVFEDGSRLRRIGNSVFERCWNLRWIRLPVSLETIDGSAFQNTDIEEIEFEGPDCLFYVSGDLIVKSRGGIAISYLGDSAHLVIPLGITVIGIRSFLKHYEISSLTFEAPCRVTRIEKEAFGECVALKSVLIPASVEVLCPRAFSHCGVSVVTFESGSRLRRIEELAFGWCDLKSFWVPPFVEFIDGSAFRGTGMTAVSIDLTASRFTIDGDFLIDASGPSLISYFGASAEPSISSRFRDVGSGCFSQCWDVAFVRFESGCSISRIGDHAFDGCARLKSIVVPKSIEILGKSCFGSCHFLGTVSFESGSCLRQLGKSAFRYCTRLQQICLPASVEILPARCFEFCGLLRQVMFELGSALRWIESRAFSDCQFLSSLSLPNAIESLSSDWYRGSSIRTVTFESMKCVKRLIERGGLAIGNRMKIRVQLREDESESELDLLDGRIEFVGRGSSESMN
jgi:hypothetical protein